MALEKNKNSLEQTPNKEAGFASHFKKHWPLFSAVIVGIIVLSVVIGTTVFYRSHALPNTTVAGINVGNKSYDEIKKIVEQQRDELSVTFAHGEKTHTAKASDIGVNVDVDKTARDAFASKQKGLLAQLQVWKTQDIPLAIDHDAGKLKDFIQKQFPEVTVNAQDAEVVFDEAYKEFGIRPAKSGQGFDIKQFETSLPNLLRDPKNITLTVTGSPVEPLITTESLLPIKQDVNNRLKLPISFSYNGQSMYTASPETIAKWISFVPDPTTGKVTITYDKSKIKQFLQDEVSPAITSPAVDRKVLVNASGEEVVLQEGKTGRTLQDVDALVDEVYNAATNNTALERQVSVTEAPFKTVTLADNNDNWVEVDLSKQTVTLFSGDTALHTFTISSGTASHPTVTGEFTVWHKNASQTMTGGDRASGDFYYLPGVTWVTYFFQDYSFHTAYWHNNFGYPMSHGCINMREADAKILYDFTPIGTRVVVHY